MALSIFTFFLRIFHNSYQNVKLLKHSPVSRQWPSYWRLHVPWQCIWHLFDLLSIISEITSILLPLIKRDTVWTGGEIPRKLKSAFSSASSVEVTGVEVKSREGFSSRIFSSGAWNDFIKTVTDSNKIHMKTRFLRSWTPSKVEYMFRWCNLLLLNWTKKYLRIWMIFKWIFGMGC